jgi:hypothetical protein
MDQKPMLTMRNWTEQVSPIEEIMISFCCLSLRTVQESFGAENAFSLK